MREARTTPVPLGSRSFCLTHSRDMRGQALSYVEIQLPKEELP